VTPICGTYELAAALDAAWSPVIMSSCAAEARAGAASATHTTAIIGHATTRLVISIRVSLHCESLHIAMLLVRLFRYQHVEQISFRASARIEM
jgi:hypothetical protein